MYTNASINLSTTNFGMCDLDLDVAIEINHYYEEAHDFRIEVSYVEKYFYFDEASNPNLTDINYDQTGIKTKLIGTYTAPYNSPAFGEPSTSNIVVHFDRIDTWTQLGATLTHAFIVKVIDLNEECAIDGELRVLAGTNDFNFGSSELYIDMRPLSYNTVTGLANGGLLFSSNGVYQTNILVDDELIIDDFWNMDASSGNRGKIMLLGGGKIVFPENSIGTLIMNEIDIATCPGEDLAEGFIVNEGAGILTEQLRMDQCTVSDCRHAINAKSKAILNISNTVFSDNYIGLNLDMSDAAGGNKYAVFKSFANNTFKTVNGLKPPYSGMPEQVEQRGFCGIRLNDYHDFNMGQHTHFEALANGLVATKTEMNIGNMTFKDIKSVNGGSIYPFTGRGVSMVSPNNANWSNINSYPWETMTFEDCVTGVYASGMAATVRNCTMSKVHYGIDWQNSKQRDIFIKDNTISAKDVGIRSFNNEPLYIGSKMENNTITVTSYGEETLPSAGIRADEANAGIWGWRMLRNPITMQKGGRGIEYFTGSAGALIGNTIVNQSPAQNYTGVQVKGCYSTELSNNTITQSTGSSGDLGNSQAILSSGGIANTFNCNCLDNTNTGMQFYDMSNFTNRVRGNDINDHVTGMKLGDENWSAVFIGTQGHRGNKWPLLNSDNSGGNGDFGAVNFSQFGLGASRFWVDKAENANFMPSANPDFDWFVEDAQSSPTYSCPSTCSFPEGFTGSGDDREEQGVTELDNLIRSNSLVGSTEELWKTRYQLYRRILRQPTLAAEPAFSAWKTAHQNTSEGKLAELAEARVHLYDLSGTDAAQAETQRLSVQNTAQQLRQLDSLRLAGSAVSPTQYATAQQNSETAKAQWKQFWGNQRVAQQQNALALRQQNAAIATTGTSDANQKTVNNLLLGMASGTALTPADIAVLDAIAQQCPTEGGDAVYEARSVAGHYLGKTYDDTACATGNREAKQQHGTATAADAVLYPNPTTGLLYWNLSGVQRVTVYNATGQTVADMNVTGQSADLSKLQNGIYQVQLRDAAGQTVTVRTVAILR